MKEGGIRTYEDFQMYNQFSIDKNIQYMGLGENWG